MPFLLFLRLHSILYFVIYVVHSSVHLYVRVLLFFFLMIRRPPRSTLDRSSAASDVYKRQAAPVAGRGRGAGLSGRQRLEGIPADAVGVWCLLAVSYTHLRAHETVLDLVCRLLLEKKK